MVFFIYFSQFKHCKAVANGSKWFQIYYGNSGAFYIGGIFRSMSPLECAFQARIEQKSKIPFAYPWITWCILEFFLQLAS